MPLERRATSHESPPIGVDIMDGLRAHVGAFVSVRYVHYGVTREKTAELRRVTDFGSIETRTAGIPFIGTDCAIRTITLGENGKVLYNNPLIPRDHGKDYARGTRHVVAELIRRSFGDKVGLSYLLEEWSAKLRLYRIIGLGV